MARKSYYHKHKELGLCVCCSDRAMPGYVRCTYHTMRVNEVNRASYYRHIDERRERRRKDIKQRIENHRCRSCGAPMLAEWETRECPNCSSRIFRGA